MDVSLGEGNRHAFFGEGRDDRVAQLTGDTEFASPETLVAFALGLSLFVVTLGLNILALYIVRKYREQYE